MKLFDVYPLFDVNIVKGKGCHVWDDKGQEYLDLYGGHAVISIGHAHPHYVETISKQVATLGFYSNSVINKLQQEVADRLGAISGYDDYQLFLINSGAEANENALKLASFYNGRTRVISFAKAFHGRTSLAVEVTNNPKIIAPINDNGHVTYLPLNDTEALKAELAKGDVCAVIIEGIQGVGGIQLPTTEFMKAIRQTCDESNTVMILDEIQSGYGRSGKFFAHQYNDRARYNQVLPFRKCQCLRILRHEMYLFTQHICQVRFHLRTKVVQPHFFRCSLLQVHPCEHTRAAANFQYPFLYVRRDIATGQFCHPGCHVTLHIGLIQVSPHGLGKAPTNQGLVHKRLSPFSNSRNNSSS